MKICDDCLRSCKEDPNCKYVKLVKGEIKLKCKDCSYRVNQWCKLYDKSYNIVMFKCAEEK